MGFNPKDAMESAKDITQNALENASEIVEHSIDAVKDGDLAGGAAGIARNVTDIAATSVEKAKEIITGRDDEADDSE